MKVSWQEASDCSAMIIRLGPGTDLIEGLEEALRGSGNRCGTIVSCIGSLRRAAYHIAVPASNPIGASYSPPIKVEGPLELLCGQGTIGTDQAGALFVHLHGVFSEGSGVLRGGHFVKGENPVLITCEMAVITVSGIEIRRKYDPEVDMQIFTLGKSQ